MKISLGKKIIVCGLAGILVLFAVHTDVPHRLPVWISESMITMAAVFLFSLCLLFIPLWQYRERKDPLNSQKLFNFWLGVIIYCEALVFFRFGFLKLLGLHMNSSLISSDFPGGSLSGYHLMDYFFGRAPAFKLLIGCLQIVGAGALLFRRTRWLGIFILIPIILNIICMDIFYEVGEGITIIAITLCIGLFYLLIQDKDKIIQLFFGSNNTFSSFPFKNILLKNSIRISVLVFTLLLLVPSVKPLKNQSIIGKYTVKQLALNGLDIPLDLNKDSILTTIYFDEHETCLLRYNTYGYMKIGKAIYNEENQDLRIIWRYPKGSVDTSYWNLELNDNTTCTITGHTGHETIKAQLIKTEWPQVILK